MFQVNHSAGTNHRSSTESKEVRQETLLGLPALFLQGMSVNLSWIKNNICYETRGNLENSLQEKSC